MTTSRRKSTWPNIEDLFRLVRQGSSPDSWARQLVAAIGRASNLKACVFDDSSDNRIRIAGFQPSKTDCIKTEYMIPVPGDHDSVNASHLRVVLLGGTAKCVHEELHDLILSAYDLLAQSGTAYQILFDKEQERLVAAAAVFAGAASAEEYIINAAVEMAARDRSAYQAMSSQHACPHSTFDEALVPDNLEQTAETGSPGAASLSIAQGTGLSLVQGSIGPSRNSDASSSARLTYREMIEYVDRSIIESILNATGGRIRLAAREFAIPTGNLRRRIAKYHIVVRDLCSAASASQ